VPLAADAARLADCAGVGGIAVVWCGLLGETLAIEAVLPARGSRLRSALPPRLSPPKPGCWPIALVPAGSWRVVRLAGEILAMEAGRRPVVLAARGSRPGGVPCRQAVAPDAGLLADCAGAAGIAAAVSARREQLGPVHGGPGQGCWQRSL